jgi:ATPase subunit of ABC transporter with duplicated ATPase domains
MVLNIVFPLVLKMIVFPLVLKMPDDANRFLSSLENALVNFPGCAVVVSHDRWFLDRTCTHILAWEGDDDNEAKWFWFEGNFAAYEENKVERLRVEAARPHRVTHRKPKRD